jgi:hypothetical protein
MNIRENVMRTFSIRIIALLTALVALTAGSYAQPWSYDFGTGTGTHSSGASGSFLPAPPSGSTRVRIGAQGGEVELRNPGDTRLGSGSEAALTGPTGGSLNKLQWYDFNGSSGFTFQAAMIVTGGTGDLYFFCGNGSCFSDNLGFTSSQVFAGLKWSRDSSGLLLSVRGSGSWSAISSAPMSPDSVHLLEVYANNSSNGITYTHGTSQSLAAFTYDVWVDNTLVVDDQQGAGLPDSLDIDSFMFYAAASPANSFTLLLDEIIFTNSVAVQPLPVELSAFEVRLHGRGVRLSWKTETELQNFGFEVQRRRDDGEWQTRGFVPGDGDRHTPKWYEYVDTLDGEDGQLQYRLKQLDRDGSSTYSPVRSLTLGARQGLFIGHPRPHPARDRVTVPLRSDRETFVTVELHSLAGTQVALLSAVRLLPAGWQELHLPCGHAARGLHVLIVRSETGISSRMVLLI